MLAVSTSRAQQGGTGSNETLRKGATANHLGASSRLYMRQVDVSAATRNSSRPVKESRRPNVEHVMNLWVKHELDHRANAGPGPIAEVPLKSCELILFVSRLSMALRSLNLEIGFFEV